MPSTARKPQGPYCVGVCRLGVGCISRSRQRPQAAGPRLHPSLPARRRQRQSNPSTALKPQGPDCVLVCRLGGAVSVNPVNGPPAAGSRLCPSRPARGCCLCQPRRRPASRRILTMPEPAGLGTLLQTVTVTPTARWPQGPARYESADFDDAAVDPVDGSLAVGFRSSPGRMTRRRPCSVQGPAPGAGPHQPTGKTRRAALGTRTAAGGVDGPMVADAGSFPVLTDRWRSEQVQPHDCVTHKTVTCTADSDVHWHLQVYTLHLHLLAGLGVPLATRDCTLARRHQFNSFVRCRVPLVSSIFFSPAFSLIQHPDPTRFRYLTAPQAPRRRCWFFRPARLGRVHRISSSLSQSRSRTRCNTLRPPLQRVAGRDPANGQPAGRRCAPPGPPPVCFFPPALPARRPALRSSSARAVSLPAGPEPLLCSCCQSVGWPCASGPGRAAPPGPNQLLVPPRCSDPSWSLCI
jgi:hypothetical protein